MGIGLENFWLFGFDFFLFVILFHIFFFLFCDFCSAWRWWHSIRLCHLSLEMWRQEGFRHLQKGFILIKHGFTFHWIFHLSSWKMLLSSHLIQNMLSTGVYQHSRCSWRSWACKAGKVMTLFNIFYFYFKKIYKAKQEKYIMTLFNETINFNLKKYTKLSRKSNESF